MIDQKKIIGLVLLLSSGLLSLSPASFGKSLSETERLNHGEVVIRQIQPVPSQPGQSKTTKDHSGSIPAVEAEILLAYPTEEIWPILSEPEKLLRDEPKVRSVKVLCRTSHQQTIAMNVLAGFLLPPFNYVLSQDLYPPNTIRFHRVSGSFKDIQGSWRLIPFEKGETLLVYTLKLDPGPFIPHGLMNMALQSDLPELMKNVKQNIAHGIRSRLLP